MWLQQRLLHGDVEQQALTQNLFFLHCTKWMVDSASSFKFITKGFSVDFPETMWMSVYVSIWVQECKYSQMYVCVHMHLCTHVSSLICICIVVCSVGVQWWVGMHACVSFLCPCEYVCLHHCMYQSVSLCMCLSLYSSTALCKWVWEYLWVSRWAALVVCRCVITDVWLSNEWVHCFCVCLCMCVSLCARVL